MDDNTVTLNVDESPAQRAIDRANAKLDEYEKRIGKLGESAGRLIETSMSAVERIAERAAAGVEKTFSAIERIALSAGQGLEAAAVSVGHVAIKLAEMSIGVGVAIEAWRILRSHITGASSDAAAHAVSIDRLLTAYREFRIASGTVASAVTGSIAPLASSIGFVAAGIAVEESLRAANNRGKTQERLAFIAARDGYDIDDIQRLRNVSRAIGQPDGFLRTATDALYEQVNTPVKGGGFNDAQKALFSMGVLPSGDLSGDPRAYSEFLADTARAFDKIVDPVERAEKAIAIFGPKVAHEILPELDEALARNIEQAEKWGAVLSDEQSGDLAKFRKNVTDAQHWLRDLTTEFSLAAEGATNWVAAMAAKGANTFIDNYKEIFGWIEAGLKKADQLVDKVIPGFSSLDNYLMEDIPSDEEFSKGLKGSLRNLQNANTDIARGELGRRLQSDAMAARDRFGNTRAGVSEQYSEAERRRDEAGRILDADRKSAQLTPQQRIAYSQEYLAGSQDSGFYKNQLQGIEDRRRAIESVIRTADEAQKERGANLSALDKITFDFAFALRPQYIVDEDGKVRSFRQPPAAVANLLEIARLKTAQELHRQSAELMAGGGRLYTQGTETGIFQGVPSFAQQDIFEFQSGEIQRQAALMPLVAARERANARQFNGGLPGDLAAFAIEDESRKHAADVRVASLEREMRLNEQLVKLQSGPGGEVRAIEQGYALRVQYAEREYQIRRSIIGDELAGEKQVEQQQEAGIERIARMAELQHQRFESLKSSVGNLFDAAFTKSGSMLQALENFVKGVILTPIKEGLSAIVAKELMPVLYGKDQKGGIIGGLFSAFGGKNGIDSVSLINGAVPVVIQGVVGPGGGSVSPTSGHGGTLPAGFPGAFGAGAALAGLAPLMGIALAGGGGGSRSVEDIGAGISATAGLVRTASGLWDRSGLPGGGSGSGEVDVEGNGLPGGSPGDFGGEVGGASGALGFFGKAKGAISGLATMFGAQLAIGGVRQGGLGGNLQSIAGGGMAGFGLASTIAPHLASGALAGGALGAGLVGAGAGLVGAGLSRGGVSGLGMDIGGGALIGMQFGGPIGAAIGAGVGAVAGLIRLGISGKSQQLHDEIKKIYGVDIPANSGVLKQILGSINSSFGGSISTGIRSPQIMQLIELYAQSTGQPFGLSNTPRAAFLTETGGGLFQSAGYTNGQSYGFASSVLGNYNGETFQRTINGSSVTTASSSTFQFDAQATRDILSGNAAQAIQTNPGLVANANAVNNQNSNGRRESANYALSPTAILG